MKEKFMTLFNTALEVADKYSLDNERNQINQAIEEIPTFRVTAPIVGGFSTGKSSLINAVIGEKLLSTNITPETAVPTEITYGNNKVTLVDKNGHEKVLSLSDFNGDVLSVSEHSLVKIETSNTFFSQIPMVKLVDMPGFDSGIEMHNRAINDYLPKSLAYILAVAADEGTLRESIILFLNELKLHKMPVYPVITKAGKVEPSVVDDTKRHIQETIKKFITSENVNVAVTNAKGKTVDTEEFKKILLDIQSKSEELGNRHFAAILSSICLCIEDYLVKRLKNDDMSLEQLQLEKEKIEQSMQKLEAELENEKSRFAGQIQHCIAAIKDKISTELNANRSSIESMLLQGTDIGAKVNAIIRNAVITCINMELEPKIQKYVTNVAEVINANIYGDTEIKLDKTTLENDKMLEKTVDTVVVPVATQLATTIATTVIGGFAGKAIGGAIGAALGPIGAAVGAVVGTLISIGVSSGNQKKQEEQRKSLAHQKANEIISSLCSEAGIKAEAAITGYVDKINQEITNEIQAKRELQEKALTDAENNLRQRKEEKDVEKAELEANLNKIRGIRNGL